MGITEYDLPLQRAYRWERERADAIFLTQPLESGLRDWTWAEAMDEARRIAAWLKAQPWEPGSRIGILSRNCAWWILSDLAIWMAGHVSVPIYPSLRALSIRQILEHSGARACFVGPTDDTTGAVSAGTDLAWMAFPNVGPAASSCGPRWEDLVRTHAPLRGDPVRPADDLATLIYTSGTTGVPKGVMHRFGSLALNAAILSEWLDLGADDRVLSYLPLAHIVERAGVEANALRLGWHLFFSRGIETFVQDLQRARPTLFLSVPRLLMKFQQGVYAKIPKRKLDRLLRIPGAAAYVKRRIRRQLGIGTVHYAACGAAPLPPDLMLWYRGLGVDLLEGYGMTETMITHLPRPGTVRPGYVGPSLPGVETALGPQNELLVRSPMNMLGYYREPEMTAAAFTADGFFKTGDVVTIDPDGQMKIVGRIKEQFKTSKGKYVSPAPIEMRLMEHPDVEACCLMGSGQPSPFAVVVLSASACERCQDPDERPAMEASLRALMAHVNATLEPFERLSMLVIAEGEWTTANGLLTPTLKLRRNLLEARYQDQMDEWREQDASIVWEAPRFSGIPAAWSAAGPPAAGGAPPPQA